jgi:hypothetical protein
MDLLHEEHPGEMDWFDFNLIHDPGECIECDAIRRLRDENDRDEDDMIEIHGFDATRSEVQQAKVFDKALKIFHERNATRGDLWARFDEHDAFHHMRSKVARVGAMLDVKANYDNDPERTFTGVDELIDDAIDLINYTAFLIRHLTDEKPDVPRSDI